MDDYQKNENGYQNGYQNDYQENYQNNWGQQGYYQNGQQGYYQNGQQYQKNQRKNHSYQELEEPMGVGEWILTMLICAIPCVNIIMMFVWAFGSGAKRSKSNWAKATLILELIGIIISIIIVMVIATTGSYVEFGEYYSQFM
ncbi:MAG: hypothetical protein SO016_11755 [Lachnospiraceae bacterium]|nr:hypothetical protein [Robinsoniella sp.]MDY3767341.1 hypothetical protein [Lachnospiraceae bacterium]